jgi:hypothetical protein
VGIQTPTIPLIFMLCEDSKLSKWLKVEVVAKINHKINNKYGKKYTFIKTF